MSVEVYAFGCVLASAALKLINRTTMKEGISPLPVLIFYNITGGLLLLPLIDLNSLGAFGASTWALLMLASIAWLVCDSLHLEALKYLSAAESDIFSTIRIVLLSVVGVIFFHDLLSSYAIVGIALVVVALMVNIKPHSLSFHRGTILALAGTLFGTVALSIDKVLLETVDPEIVAVIAFLIPGSILLIRYPSAVRSIVPSLRLVGLALVITPLIGVVRYLCMVHAYHLGQISSVTVILQATVCIVFILEYLILRDRDHWLRRGLASAACAIGATLVCIF